MGAYRGNLDLGMGGMIWEEGVVGRERREGGVGALRECIAND